MTINAFKSTILCDEETFRWALCFIDHLIFIHEVHPRKAMRFRMLHIFVLMFELIVFLCLSYILIVQPILIGILGMVMVFIMVFTLEVYYKNFVAQLLGSFIASKLSAEELGNKTLLQLGQFLEGSYGTLPMVETFLGWQMFFRRVFLGSLLIILMLNLFSFFKIKILILLCGAFILRAMTRSTILTRFLRHS